MKKRMTRVALLSLMAIAFVACKKDEPVKFTDVTIEVSFPENYSGTKEGVEVKWENISSKQEGTVTTNASGIATLTVEQGNYNFYASKKAEAVFYQGKADNLNVISDKQTVKLTLSASYVSTTWVIKEIYFSGSKTPADKNYYKDQYIEIYNNSNETLYADGLIFCKTYDNTMMNNNWGQYLEKNEIVPYFVFQVPGSGKEHPVAPGKSLILADQGLNHKVDNPNSPVDLSKADFEWYEDHRLDVDAPEVPNLIKRYSGSLSVSSLHSRGYEGYFIVQLPVAETEAFLAAHQATTKMPNGSNKDSYVFPASYIIDAVQCAAPEGYESAVFPALLDAGYSFCDGGGTGKCVQRKFQEEKDGRTVLKDTNNSTEDFTPNAIPSPRVVVK